MRMVIALQVSSNVACQLAERVKNAYPMLQSPLTAKLPHVTDLQAFGLPKRRAECCVTIVRKSSEILARVQQGQNWQEALAGIKGIGPWTISVFRIMVLRDPDEFPTGDIGLKRAIINIYGRRRRIDRLSESWRPFRSVACWYLWRTLGNKQLG